MDVSSRSLQDLKLSALQMEDMLDLVQHGAIKALDLRANQDQLKETDQAYIHAKLQQLHQHAEAMLESVLQNPNITEESVRQMAQHEKYVCAFLCVWVLLCSHSVQH